MLGLRVCPNGKGAGCNSEVSGSKHKSMIYSAASQEFVSHIKGKLFLNDNQYYQCLFKVHPSFINEEQSGCHFTPLALALFLLTSLCQVKLCDTEAS